MAKKKGVTERVLHDPIADRLTPTHPLDLSKARTSQRLFKSFEELEVDFRDAILAQLTELLLRYRLLGLRFSCLGLRTFRHR